MKIDYQNRQHIGKKSTKGKTTIYNVYIKHEPHLKPGLNSGAPAG
jgi:hypothetical protein